MWRWLTVFLLGGVLGAAFGVALGFFLFPFVFPPPEAKDQLTQTEAGKLLAKGEFIHAKSERSDPLRQGWRERARERGVPQ
jgi:membrane protein YqaA with SNARE-associated domain